MRLAIGLDIGTTSTIGVLVAPDGRTLAHASRPATLRSPRPGWAEEDPEEWWANAAAILRDLAARVPAGDAVAGIGVAGMVPAVVLLDRAGAPIRPSIQQSDARTGPEVAAWAERFDEAAHLRRTGTGINQQLVGPKTTWLARHEPDVLPRVATLFGSYDFIVSRLTGRRSVERNWALESGLTELATGAWAADLVAAAGIDPAWLPAIRRSDEIVGELRPDVARATGLPAGIPVVAGCADHVSSAFAAGITEPGDVLVKFGGAGDILAASAAPHGDPRLFLDHHIRPGLWMPNGCMASSGAVLNWIVATFGRGLEGEARPHARLDEAAAAVEAAEDGLLLLPYFLGEKTPIHDPAARGTIVGLGLHHALPHVWRAALEGIAFAFRHHLDVMREIGLPASRFVASDGGSASPLWMQITADVLGVELSVPEGHPGSALGAAFVAGMATGLFSGWGEIARFVGPGRRYLPGAAAARYDAPYAAWRELYGRLQPLFPRLGRGAAA